MFVVIFVLGWARYGIEAWGDIHFLVNDVNWEAIGETADNVAFSPWLQGVALVIGIIWLGVIGLRPVPATTTSTLKTEGTSVNAKRKGGRIIPRPEDDFVESDGVLWQWYQYRKGGGGMDGPLCPWTALTLDYQPPAEVKPPRPTAFGKEEGPLAAPFSFESILPKQTPKRREPTDEDEVGGPNGGTLVCFKCNREFRLSKELLVFNDPGKTVGEARKRAREEFRAKVRQQQLTRPSAPDKEDSQNLST